MHEVIAVIGVFGVVPLTIWIVLHFGAKRHGRALESANKLIERGDVLTDDIIKSLGINPASPLKDLKIGLILIAVALSILIIGHVIPDDSGDAAQVSKGLASLPFLIGLVYSAFWFISRKDK